MSGEEREWTPDLGRLTQASDDSLAVGRVYGEAYEHDGTLVIPVARVVGGASIGAGGGGGTWSGSGTGRGGGTGSGRGSGSGRLGRLRRARADVPELEASAAGAPAAEDAAHGIAGDGTGTGALGDAQAEAKGDLQGEAKGDARGSGGTGGGAYGVQVRPLGVVVVEQGHARWVPVVDANRVILGGQVAAAVAAVAIGWGLRRRNR
ncbi:hypothetical protein [Luteimicrobium subarcticum]|uniref:Sporulation protein YtfJ n=1 Tax=Luteimicrobium subarcticum TaxID=620910 RepID=A0A2M8WTP4_9MICO|nr:hypothetical protein [Luteimicrobium subarcticum]PJI94310.1 hypothetical protein CLV34_0146 [Luteimicrobium subarcticum]